MAKKKNSLKILEGALAGAALGVMAGMLLAPESGKALRKDVKKKSAEFYNRLSTQLKKAKKMSEEDYKEMVEKAMKGYAKAKKLSEKEVKELTKQAKSHWKHFKKHA